MEELEIPIFRKTYDLYKAFHGLRNVVPKADRHTIWQRAETLILELIESILLASQLPKERKLPALEQASVKLNVLRILLRLIRDTKALDLKKCVPLQEMVDEIGRMLGGWMKSTKAHSPSPSASLVARERERERERVVSLGRRKCRAEDRPRLSLRLSSQLLLTFRPLSSKLPTLTRLPSESWHLPVPVW